MIGTTRLVEDFDFPKPGFNALALNIRYMGQDILNPPTVEGWHTGKEWIDSGTLVERINFTADYLAKPTCLACRTSSHGCVPKGPTLSPERLVDGCLELLGGYQLAAETRNELVTLARTRARFEPGQRIPPASGPDAAVDRGDHGIHICLMAKGGDVMAANKKDPILVVLQLSGGNDALNTVIPYGNPLYCDNRPNVRIPEDQVLPLNKDVGFHPAMGPLKALYDEGKVAVIQGIGYPKPSRSHFRSMDIWHTCEPDKIGTEGWLGRAIREIDPQKDNVLTGVNFGRGLPRALSAPGVPVASVGNLETYGVLTGIEIEEQRTKALDTFARTYDPDARERPGAVLLRADGPGRLERGGHPEHGSGEVCLHGEVRRRYCGGYMRNIVQTHLADLGTRILYTTAPYNSFDTHAGELANHTRLWTQTSKAVGHSTTI